MTVPVYLLFVLILAQMLSACTRCKSDHGLETEPSTEKPAGQLTVPEDQNHLSMLGEYATEPVKQKPLSPIARQRLQTIAERAKEFPKDATSLQTATGLYLAHCARCHGNEGQGNGPEEPQLAIAPTNLRQWPLKFGERTEDLVYTITYGRSEKVMPSFRKELKEKEIWALAYLVQDWRSSAKSDDQEAQSP